MPSLYVLPTVPNVYLTQVLGIVFAPRSSVCNQASLMKACLPGFVILQALQPDWSAIPKEPGQFPYEEV